jgi:hypothetical protein
MQLDDGMLNDRSISLWLWVVICICININQIIASIIVARLQNLRIIETS